MDPLEKLPYNQEDPTQNDLEIIRTLFGEGKKASQTIRKEEVIILTVVFVILCLPWTDRFLKLHTIDNDTGVLIIKAVVFCVILVFLQIALKPSEKKTK
jgi:di/tricarboxylate transporter